MLNCVSFPKSLHYYESTIKELEAYPIEEGQILLYGSSFFRNWGFERARKQLEAASGGRLKCVNHGFGGALNDHLLYYYDRMVRPYAPRAIILRTGVNDILKGNSPDEAIFLLQRLVQWLKEEYPAIPILIMGIFDTKRFTQEEQRLAMEYNAGIHDLIPLYEKVSYLDVTPFFYDNEADIGDMSKLRNVFLEDGLHLTDEGYEEMSHYFAQQVLKLL